MKRKSGKKNSQKRGKGGNIFDDIGDWFEGAAEDTGNWIEGAAKDTADWTKHAIKDTVQWGKEALGMDNPPPQYG